VQPFQRVTSAKVHIQGREAARIGQGLLVLLGIEESDNARDIQWLSKKICQMRIFNDSAGIMNVSVQEVDATFSRQSVYSSCQHQKGKPAILHQGSETGNRHSLYEQFIRQLETISGRKCKPVHSAP